MRTSIVKHATIALLVLIATCGTAQPAWSYCEEVHYALTYYLARTIGYTPEQCRRLASACQAVDDSALTGPVQAGNVLSATSSAQPARVSFHAFMDEQLYASCLQNSPTGELQRQKAKADILRRREQLFQAATGRNIRNPGLMLHFLQDETAHSSFGSFGGHWASTGFQPDLTLLPGACADYLASHDEAYHLEMLRLTLFHLKRFMHEQSPAQEARKVDWNADVLPIFRELRNVNPAGNLTLGFNLSSPDFERACNVVEKALIASGDLAPFSRRIIPFEFTAGGLPTDPDGTTLYGTLILRVLDDGGLDILTPKVAIIAAPTMSGESSRYLVEPQEIRSTVLSFENLPVGEITLAVTTPTRTVYLPITISQRTNFATIVSPTSFSQSTGLADVLVLLVALGKTNGYWFIAINISLLLFCLLVVRFGHLLINKANR